MARWICTLLAVCVVLAATEVSAAEAERRDVDSLVERLIDLVRENYVVEERLPKIERGLRAAFAAGRYQESAAASTLALRLTDDLRAVSGDLHFGVRPAPQARPSTPSEPSGETAAASGPGIGRVAVLEGNVGYLEIRAFIDPSVGGPAADTAFEQLAATDALIVDLRSSRGGRPEMVGYLLSYLFDGEPFVFNRFEWRNSGATIELLTEAELPSPRYTDRRVYLLTSSSTPSAAEGFCYHLQQLGRATVVGERTAGAAHTFQLFTLDDLQVAIPTGRPVSPVSGGNWEGVGVGPDHETPAAEALALAHRLALAAVAG